MLEGIFTRITEGLGRVLEIDSLGDFSSDWLEGHFFESLVETGVIFGEVGDGAFEEAGASLKGDGVLLGVDVGVKFDFGKEA